MDRTSEQDASNGEPLSNANVLKDIQSLWYELRELSHDHFRLAALETQRAGVSLVSMIVTGVMLAFLMNAVWFGLMAAVVFSLIENGLETSSAILLAVAFSLLLMLILIGVIRRNSYYLQYPAIIRSLQPMPPAHREKEQS
jgi:hypothetical protein